MSSDTRVERMRSGIYPTDPKVLAYHRSAWKSMFERISKRESASMFADVDVAMLPPYFADYGEPQGVLGMQILARACQRRWSEANGVEVFSQDQAAAAKEQSIVDWAFSWFHTLGQDEVRQLAAGEFSLTSLPPNVQTRAELQIASFEPEMLPTVINDPGRIRIGLSVMPVAEKVDPVTGEGRELALTAKQDATQNALHAARGAPTARAITPLQRSAGGALAFGAGDVLRMADILDRAQQAFGTRYQCDSRLMGSWYFVSGSFSQPAFEGALEILGRVSPIMRQPPGPTRHTEEIRRLLGGQLGALVDGPFVYSPSPDSAGPGIRLPVPAADLLQGATTVSHITGSNPALDSLFTNAGFALSDIVTLRPVLVLDVEGGGWVNVSHGDGDPGGNVPNGFRLGLP